MTMFAPFIGSRDCSLHTLCKQKQSNRWIESRIIFCTNKENNKFNSLITWWNRLRFQWNSVYLAHIAHTATQLHSVILTFAVSHVWANRLTFRVMHRQLTYFDVQSAHAENEMTCSSLQHSVEPEDSWTKDLKKKHRNALEKNYWFIPNS